MDASPFQPESADTPLARLLHARGRLPLDVIQSTLAESRAARPDGPGLAARLIERGLLDAAEAARWQSDLGTPLWGPGAIVGEHRLLERIGAGGMGAVDLAEHLPTGARRAIKSLPVSGDLELTVRFQREGEAMAQAGRHPAVVRVHSVGRALGRQYLVMEHLPGGDLAQRLRGGPLAPEAARRLGIALARGLAHVHGRGVLHRDLKPQNVLFDAAGDPVLVDFGLARASGSQALTRTGDLMGTPAYMAPEQALGLVRELDARTDVYGLGAVLYHALTGQPPFEARTQMALLEQVVHAAPRPPASARPGVPPALEAVVMRALAKSPADRWPDATALAEALEAAGRAPPASRGWRLPLLAGGALLSVALGLAALLLGPQPPAPPARSPSPAAPVAPAPPASVAPVSTAAPDAAPDDQPPAAGVGLPARAEDVPRYDPAQLAVLEPTEREQLQRLIESMKPAGYLIAASSLRVRYTSEAQHPLPVRRARLAVAASLFRELTLTPGVDRASLADAWRQLGEMFVDGVWVPPRSQAALRCMERGVELGDPASHLRLAELRWPDRPDADPAQAARLLREGLALGTDSDQHLILVFRALDLAEIAPGHLPREVAIEAAERQLARTDDDGLRLRVAQLEVQAGQLERARAHLQELTGRPGQRVAALTLLLAIAPRPAEYAEALSGLDRPEGEWTRDERLQLARWHQRQGRDLEAARLLWADALNLDAGGVASAEALLDLCQRQSGRGESPFRSRAEIEALLARTPLGQRRLEQRRAEGR